MYGGMCMGEPSSCDISSICGGAQEKQQKPANVKKIMSKMVLEVFIKYMKNLKPSLSIKEITEVYKKHKKDINDLMADAVINKIKTRGGAVKCGDNQYSSGDKCYDKQVRPKVFDRTPYDIKNNMASDIYGNRINQLGTKVVPQMLMPRTSLALVPQITDTQSTQNEKSENRGVFEELVRPIIGEDRSPFGTDGSDISDPRAWADTLYNIGRGTLTGLKSIFDVVSPLSWFT